MSEQPTPRPGEVWQRKDGKRRIVAEVEFTPTHFRHGTVIHWRAVGPNHGQNSGSMLLVGWLRSWRKVEEAPDA